MPNKQIEKLKVQVKRYEDKGYFDTAAHQMLKNLLKEDSVEGVSPRSTPEVTQEKPKNGK